MITPPETTTITILLNVFQTLCNPAFSCIVKSCPKTAELLIDNSVFGLLQ